MNVSKAGMMQGTFGVIKLVKKPVKLTVNDLTKIYGEKQPLEALLTEEDNTPLPNKELVFTINGVPYTRDTDDAGIARLNINLIPGSYSCSIGYRGDSEHEYALEYANVTVKKQDTTLITQNFTKTYGDGRALKVTLYENVTTGPVAGKDVLFTINGVVYTRTTDADGVAKLNINLRKGEYRCTVDCPEDNIHKPSQSNLIVKVMTNTFMDGTNITKMEDELVVYQCAVYDPWERVDCDVVITVNGISYNRHTEGDGLARLNVRLPAGEYDIKAEFKGDEFNHGSSVINHISSKKYAPDLSTTSNGVIYPGNNIGFVESHVMVKQWSPDVGKAKKVIFWDDTDAKFHKDISFTSYEITETDPRVKTAKFTTREYFDLTGGQCWAYISSPYHENFGGRILKVDYDKDKGLYTYQCQDGRRNYMTKFRMILKEDASDIVYNNLKWLLMSPLFPDLHLTTPESRKPYLNHKILSGLRPLDAYELEQKSSVLTIKAQNMYKNKAGDLLSYDSTMDKIMNLAHINGTPVDVYFTPEGVCQIEPVNWDVWMKTGFKITHTDLASYKYGFDTTNILTGVYVQTPNAEGYDLTQDNGKRFNDTVAELGYYFGGNIGMISPVTKQVETESSEEGSSDSGSSSSSNNNSSSGGGGYFVDMGKPHKFAVGSDNIDDANERNMINKVISALEAKGHSAYSLGVGPSVDQNHGLSSSSKGEINIFIVGGICAGTVKDYADGLGSYYHYDGMIMMFANCTTDNWISCNALRNKNQVRAHDDGFSSGIDYSITPHQMFEKHKNKMAYIAGQPNESFDSLVQKLVNGQFNCGNTGTASASSDTSENKSTTTTVVDEVATLDKAMSEVSKSVRDLLSFEIKIPLNHSMFKELHTNQWLWTELPTEFKLGNLSRIFYLMKAWKQNRGVEYMLNRWYIEKIVTKMDSNGLFATLTLNPFPSSYSVYSDALKSYRDAYDQAYRQKEEQKTDGSSSSSGSGPGEPRLGNDSTETSDIACATGRYHGHAGDNENFDNCAKKGYAQKGRNYYNWARQFKTPIELAKALNDMYTEASPMYSNHRHSNAEQTFNAKVGNCWDGCRLVKCCFDAAGFDCIVVTGNIYGYGHGWNAVKHNGRWYTFDLLFDYTSRGDWGGTNTLRMAHEW